MKFVLIIFLTTLLFNPGSLLGQSTSAEKATRLTREMTAAIKLNEGEMIQVKKFNLDKFTQIDALAKMRHLTRRQIDLKLDQIEEAYSGKMFNVLNSRQYAAYKKFQERNPEYYNLTYRSVFLAASGSQPK